MTEHEESFAISVDNNPPKVAYVRLPIGKYIDNKEDGMALLHGKMREAEAHLAKLLQVERAKRNKLGVIGANGKPVYPGGAA